MIENSQVKTFQKEIKRLDKKEKRFLDKKKNENQMKVALLEKVPKTLQKTLEKTFQKAFETIFLHGTGVIEKTFNKEDLKLEYEALDYMMQKKTNKRMIKRVDRLTKKSNVINQLFTSASGFGMGLLGMGLPDIPLLTATLLQGVYQTATGYGFAYDTAEEKLYILRLIRLALSDYETRQKINQTLDEVYYEGCNIIDEIAETAKVLSNALLVEKFVQGIPIVGVVGGFTNYNLYKKVSSLSKLKYKKRYLTMQIEKNIKHYNDKF